MQVEQVVKSIGIFFAAFFVSELGLFSLQALGESNTSAAGLQEAPAVQEILELQEVPVLQTAPAQEPAAPKAAVTLSVNIEAGQTTTLFSLDADKKLPVASLTKLMTALVALQNYEVTDPIIISAEAMAIEGEQGSLKLGETLPVKSLLRIMLIESSNRAAYALAEHMGVDPFIIAMNEMAQSLGFENTHFVDSSGLSADSYSTAADIAMLTQHLFEHQPLFGEMVSLPTYDLYVNDVLHHTLINTNQLLGQQQIVGGKTGYTDIAKGCLMAIQKTATGYNVHVVLGAEDRFGEVEKLIK